MYKNTHKFYNLIFPIWILILIPPYLIAAVIANLLIDALVVRFVLTYNRVVIASKIERLLILKVFLAGYLADFIGMGLLISVYVYFEPTINYFHIWESPLNVIVHLIAVIITGFIIFGFNMFIFRNIEKIDHFVRFRLALALAVITAPWTFLISASIFY